MDKSKFPGKGINCLYLLHLGGDLIKIGKTSNLQIRFSKYQKANCLCFATHPEDVSKIEKLLIGAFRDSFTRYTGREWFLADLYRAETLFKMICGNIGFEITS